MSEGQISETTAVAVVGERRRGVPRSFDYDEAKRRYAAGETQVALAAEFGVSAQAVYLAIHDKRRAASNKRATQYTKDNYRVPCRGGCGSLVWTHGTRPKTGYCPTCLGEKRRVVRHGTEKEYAQGCRCEPCRLAANAARRARRHATRVPCSHGCGTLVDRPVGDSKPPECQPCAHRRIYPREET